MTCSGRFARAALIAGGLLGLACGDSGGPIGPKSLAAIAGDGQFWIVGAPLPAPLQVRVIGSGDRPLAGATVSWAVTAGSATVGAASSETDLLGIAAMTVTLGAVAEPVAVRASVTGLAPVTFTAAACAVSAFTLGATVPAALATTDCRANGFYTDAYSLDLTSGPQGLTIADSSGAFDAYLEFYGGDGALLAVNDDIDPGVIQHSLLRVITAPGNYVIAPSSYDPDTTGPYSLTAASWPPALAGCESVWVMRGVTVTDSLTPADCAAPGPYYGDVVTIVAAAGSVLTIAQRSTAFDAFLELYLDPGPNQSLIFIAANDDSGGVGPDAYLIAAVPQTAKYVLFAATADTAATGPYTLTISGSATLNGSARAERSPAVPRMASSRAPKGLPRRGWRR